MTAGALAEHGQLGIAGLVNSRLFKPGVLRGCCGYGCCSFHRLRLGVECPAMLGLSFKQLYCELTFFVFPSLLWPQGYLDDSSPKPKPQTLKPF